jgi:hypothetical protein
LVTKKRKTIDIYEALAHKNEQMLAKSLEIQTETHQLRTKRAVIAEKQLGVLQAAVRMKGCQNNSKVIAGEIQTAKSRIGVQDAKRTRRESNKEETILTVIPQTARNLKQRCWMSWNKFSRSCCLPKMQ